MPRKILTLAVALALGGCMTAQQWTKNPPLTTVNDDRAFGGDNSSPSARSAKTIHRYRRAA